MTHEQEINCEVCKDPQGCKNWQQIQNIKKKGMPVNDLLIRSREYFLNCPFLRAEIDKLLLDAPSNPTAWKPGEDTLNFRRK